MSTHVRATLGQQSRVQPGVQGLFYINRESVCKSSSIKIISLCHLEVEIMTRIMNVYVY